MKSEVDIKANMITWAISRAGYELHEFAAKFPKVIDWLNNKKKPTVKQLEAFSHKVHLPFGYLFLNEPPKENLSFPFFRTGNTNTKTVSLNVYDTIQLTQRRQEWLAEYLQEEDFEKLPFVGKYSNSTHYKTIVLDIRKTLNLENEWANKFDKFEDTLEYITQKIEEIGIIINFNGVVENNNTRPIKVDDCRGFVLIDPFAPFMFVNAADGKGAQLFTIIHELAHVWIGQSAGFDNKQMLPANDPTEELCDAVAAEFLVPEESFNLLWDKHPNIPAMSRYYKVSQIVIARRALDLGKISRKDFYLFYNDYINALRLKKEKQGSGGDFYATQKKRLSLRFVAHVNQALKGSKLLYRDAYRLTGLKGDTYQNFIKEKLF